MKKLTNESLTEILRKAVAATGYEADEGDVKNLFASVKVGEEAENHTGSKGALGYFATEGTVVSSMYYDAPSLYWKFEEAVNAGLAKIIPGAFAEPINSVEFAIYN